MPAVQPSLTPAATEPLHPDATIDASRNVSAMHMAIEQGMTPGLDIIAPLSGLDRAVETASRWAAYPALAIAAIFIERLLRTAFA
ncbi:hypothetical protein [Sphingobium aromaticiconvertens]|uniref:hypothetical protein n=1 Tax=Sphingobium aromaticiconvertens TaxID=365341 RepID=UPI003017F613